MDTDVSWRNLSLITQSSISDPIAAQQDQRGSHRLALELGRGSRVESTGNSLAIAPVPITIAVNERIPANDQVPGTGKKSPGRPSGPLALQKL